MIELFDSLKETKPRLEGEDTICKVTIIDEDRPGKISFKDINIKVIRPETKGTKARINIIRLDGADGRVEVKVKVDKSDGLKLMNKPAEEYVDFAPYDNTIIFEKQEIE